jgi:hypothetical protein
MSFLKSIVKTAGKGLKVVGKVSVQATGIPLAAKTTKAIGKQAGKIPVVGKPLKAIVNLGGAPVSLASSILQGERIDQAVLNNLKQQVRDVKTVGPYAQMVVSLVPGIGTGISAGLGAGLALADGQPIDAAIKAGVEGALPGGPLAKSAFNVTVAIVQKKSIDNIAIAALPLPDAQKKALSITLDATVKMAKGQRIDKVALTAAEKALPTELKPAMNIGIAIAQGANLQKAMLANVTPEVLIKLAGQGGAVIAVNPAMKAGYATFKDKAGQSGFAVGAAVSRFQVTPAEVVAIRNKLNPAQKKGFDTALVGHIGAVENKAPTAIQKNPAATFAFNAAVGAQALTKGNQDAIVKQIVKSPQARAAVTAAINAGPKVALGVTVTPGTFPGAIAYVKPVEKGFWHKLFVALGFIKE